MASSTVTRVEFVCPGCGGNTFGSSRNDDGTLTYRCHGFAHKQMTYTHYCQFTWHESDMYKYMVLVTATRFESRELYDRVTERRDQVTDLCDEFVAGLMLQAVQLPPRKHEGEGHVDG